MLYMVFFALIAAIMMFIPKKQVDDMPLDEVTFNKPLAAVLALIVGIGSGIVGAAGGFLLVPIMLTVLTHSNTNDDCHKFSRYIYFFHWG